jgi:hypothetical protein
MPVSDTRVGQGQGKPTTEPAASTDQGDGRNLKEARWVLNSRLSVCQSLSLSVCQSLSLSVSQSLSLSVSLSRAGYDACSLVSTYCYRARDAFYACVEKDPAQDAFYACVEKDPSDSRGVDAAGASFSCEALRAAYEGACQASWVRHFEAQREKEQQVYRRIQAAIGEGGKR